MLLFACCAHVFVSMNLRWWLAEAAFSAVTVEDVPLLSQFVSGALLVGGLCFPIDISLSTVWFALSQGWTWMGMPSPGILHTSLQDHTVLVLVLSCLATISVALIVLSPVLGLYGRLIQTKSPTTASWRMSLLVLGTLASLTCAQYCVLNYLLQQNTLELVLRWVLGSRVHVAIIAWWGCVLAGMVLAAWCVPQRGGLQGSTSDSEADGGASQRWAVPNIVVRKFFHFGAVALFLPALALAPSFLAVAMAVALQLMVGAEVIRVLSLPVLGATLHKFMARFVDERDKGTAILTHMFLLLGCALPVWSTLVVLVLAHAQAAQGKPVLLAELAGQNLAAMESPAVWQSPQGVFMFCAAAAGLITVGVGDAMAAVVGTLVGGKQWPGSRKTLAGTLAGAASMLACLWACTAAVYAAPIVVELLTCPRWGLADALVQRLPASAQMWLPAAGQEPAAGTYAACLCAAGPAACEPPASTSTSAGILLERGVLPSCLPLGQLAWRMAHGAWDGQLLSTITNNIAPCLYQLVHLPAALMQRSAAHATLAPVAAAMGSTLRLASSAAVVAAVTAAAETVLTISDNMFMPVLWWGGCMALGAFWAV